MELHNNVSVKRVVGPVAIGANGTITGKIIDRQGYGGVQFVLGYGAIATSGTVCTPVVFEGDVTGTMTSVADTYLLGTEALAARAAAALTSGTTINVAKRVGYKGNKRYVRVDIVKTGTTSVGCVDVKAVLFNPNVAPVANP
jgi:hypothetical protein